MNGNKITLTQFRFKRVNLICVWKGCCMNITEVSKLLQITLKILKNAGGGY